MSVRKDDFTDDVLKDIDAATQRFLRGGGASIESNMKQRAPVDLGNLRNSILANVDADGDGPYVDVGPTAEYAPYVEYGTGRFVSGGRQTPWTYFDEKLGQFVTTSGMRAQPFAKPGFDAARPTIDRLAARELKV